MYCWWQAGYTSDGQTCQECPEGKTCSRTGEVACEGQCGAGVLSRCDPVWGYARCDLARCGYNVSTAVDGKIVVRGSFVDAGNGSCTPYFRCDVGWYKRFLFNGLADCSPCMNKPSGRTRYVTAGMSSGDDMSCLWECDASDVGVAWDFELGRCLKRFVAGVPQEEVPNHPAGGYGMSSRRGWSTCPARHTSRANTALAAEGCLPCPAMPEGAEEVVGSRNCEWKCGNGWRQRGSRCLRVVVACSGPGVLRLDTGECVPGAVPWNRAGTRRAWPPVRVDKERSGVAAPPAASSSSSEGGMRIFSVGVTGSSEAVIRAGSMAGGLTGRHWVEVGGAQVLVEGPVCSVTRLVFGKYDFLVCAVCNESFVAFVNLSTPVDTGGVVSSVRRRLFQMDGTSSGSAATTMRGERPALQVLIGQGSRVGWADGFKTQALFGGELYVANGTRGVVWVLDRWNCLVREVVIGPKGPGDYLTRVYTVHGLTERFMLVPPLPKCYGPGSLAGPRRFWDIGGGLLVFSDDTGLWQLEASSGALARVLDESWDVGTMWAEFEADDVVSVWVSGTGVNSVVGIGFRDGTEWDVVADTVKCEEDYTSYAGGDCTLGCAWQDGSRYVDPVSGACVSCGNLQCGVGQRLVKCTRSTPARCEACPAAVNGKVYVVAGRCNEDEMRFVAPCPVGFYLSGQYCVACGDPLRTTMFAGATRPEQCKCRRGLRWSKELGKCIGQGLYSYEDGACVRRGEPCLVPPNATVVDAGRCMWECNVGFFLVTGPHSGWLEKCSVCNRGIIEAGLNASTRGDDDSPWSCEFLL